MRKYKADAIAKAEKSYGKVSVDEFQKAVKTANALPDEPDNTLREDYSIGVDLDGMFYVSYACSCSKCGFKFEFKEEKQVA